MKKSWSIALILAVLCVGQGIFAQEEEEKPSFRLTATFRSGLFAMFTDMVDDGPYLSMGSTEESSPLYLLVKGYYVNSGKTAGIDTGFLFKSSHVDINANRSYSTNYDVKVDNTYGWLKMLNGLFTLYAGYGEWEYAFTSGGALDSNIGFNGLGSVLVISPLAPFTSDDLYNLRFGVSAYSTGDLGTLINEAKYIFSAQFDIKDTFRTVANFAYRQYGPKFYADKQAGSRYNEEYANDHRLNFGISYFGLNDLIGLRRIAFDMEVRNLGGGLNAVRYPLAEFNRDDLEGMTVYPLHLGQNISWAKFGARLNFNAKQMFRLGDEHEEYAPSLSFSITAAYDVNDFITPKAGFETYINSRAWGAFPTDLRFGEGATWGGCTKNTGGIGAYGAVEFRVGGRATRNAV